IAHEILENDSNFPPQIFNVILAEIHSIQENLTTTHVIQPRQQLYDGCLTLPVLAHQGNAFGRLQSEVDVTQHRSGIPRIAKGNIFEFEPFANRTWSG